ncbi:MAG: hypothetical protein QOD47_1978 [Gemmatimonadaceae bacterium]|jgi:hypothetical protein|nr:hypothetical protein [Gemmatimonadaceae bacterium]
MTLFLALQSASGTPDSIVSTVNRFTDFLLGYVGALAAVGALSMALIEAAKKLLDSRTRFQALRWTQWLQRSPFEASVIPSTSSKGAALSLPAAYGQLLQLSTGVPATVAIEAAERLLASKGHLSARHAFVRSGLPAHALFALDLQRMMGSIQEAADIALASPRQYASLYLLMTSGADPSDISRWYEEGPDSMISIANPDQQDRKSIKEHADRFARLRQIVKRKLDGFQLYAGDSWASWNQTVANIVGIVALFLILMWVKNTSTTSPGYLTIVVLSLFGGILSPIAKDLVSALKRVKDG